jgi:hypothetical protein
VKSQEPQQNQPIANIVEGVEALCHSSSEVDAKKDLRLCAVCMQWVVDGHNCYRKDVCPDEVKPA